MYFAADYPFLNIFWTMIIFFCWVIWFWMVITILADVFTRHDISGWGKAGWCVVLIVIPFLGVLIYLIAHSKDMAERRQQQSQKMQSDFDDHVRTVAADAGPASQIAKAKDLLDSGAITEVEFNSIKAKALA